jgi:hypothetical protein
VAKLSKLQRFILLEAAKSLPGLEERAKGLNEWLSGAVAMGFLKEFKPVRPSDLPHITRTFILINFFRLSLRKRRWGGQLAEDCGLSRITDQDTNRIDAEAAGKQYNRANASLYRAIKRLERRGLIRRMVNMRGDLQLTAEGVAVANALRSQTGTVSRRSPNQALPTSRLTVAT